MSIQVIVFQLLVQFLNIFEMKFSFENKSHNLKELV